MKQLFTNFSLFSFSIFLLACSLIFRFRCDFVFEELNELVSITLSNRSFHPSRAHKILHRLRIFLQDGEHQFHDDFLSYEEQICVRSFGFQFNTNFTFFLRQISTILPKHEYILKALVVGLGPSGLLSAIAARRSGWKVQGIEMRRNYTRDQWIDICSPPYCTLPKRVLQDFGFFYFDQEYELIDGEHIVILLQVLERALSKVAFLMGVEFSYGTTFRNSISKDASNTNDFMNDYDVNVLANGRKKSIGESFGFQAFDENTVHIDLLEFDENITLEEIVQISLIVDVKPVNGACLEKLLDENGDPLDPWHCGWDIPEVHSVYRRFYDDICQLQILFRHEVPKNKYKEIIKEVMELTLDIDLWDDDIIIDSKILRTAISRTNDIVRKVGSKWIVAVGDASLTAHYRLGIGVNGNFMMYPFLEELFERFALNIDVLDANTLKSMMRLKEDLTNYQVSTVFYEVFCDFIVGFMPQNILGSARELFRRSNNREYVPVSAGDLRRCIDSHEDHVSLPKLHVGREI